jgi:predicted  nucleic acid-binding Zn-ribbon protein
MAVTYQCVGAWYRIAAMTTLREHLSRLGKKGGKARAERMTAEQRRDSARKAVEARWAKAHKDIVKADSRIEKNLAEIRENLKKAKKRKD